MGLYVRQDEKRSELQQRIAAELREKAKRNGANDGDRPDGVSDSRYLENTKETTSLARVWAVIGVIAFIVAVLFMIQLAS